MEIRKKAPITASGPQRPLARGRFSDEQLERAGAGGSVKAGHGTIYDFCGTIHWCTTYTTTCPRLDM